MNERAERKLIHVPKDAKILIVPDTHFPWADYNKLKEVYSLTKQERPDIIIQIGDLYDLYSFSRFARSLNLTTPKLELAEGRKAATEMWETLKRRAPKARRFLLRGNHSHRLVKSIMDKAPEYETLLDEPVNRLTKFDGVKDMKDYRSELVLDHALHGPITFIHGWSVRPGYHMGYFNTNTVFGHTHRGHVLYRPGNDPIWELNVGHLADVNALPLNYNDTKTANWISGVGLIDEKGPRFVHL